MLRKYYLALGLLFILNQLAYSQLSISCTHRTVCRYSDFTEKYSNCNTDEEVSLFQFNEDQTLFTHTTPSIKSTYYVKSKEQNKLEGYWIVSVVSDVGNEYNYYIDLEEKILFTIVGEGSSSYTVAFKIKAVF